MGLGQKHFVICTQCGCNLRAERFSKHLRRIHGLDPTGAEITQAISKMTSEPKTRAGGGQMKTAERVAAKRNAVANFIKRIVSKPHKCATAGCKNLISATEELCRSCKKGKLDKLFIDPPKQIGKEPCACGNRALPGENYCYDCIGD